MGSTANSPEQSDTFLCIVSSSDEGDQRRVPGLLAVARCSFYIAGARECWEMIPAVDRLVAPSSYVSDGIWR